MPQASCRTLLLGVPTAYHFFFFFFFFGLQDSCPFPSSKRAFDSVPCHLLAVLSLLCIVWITVLSVEIAAQRRVRLPSGISFFCGKF